MANDQLGAPWEMAGKYDAPAGSMKCSKRSCHDFGTTWKPFGRLSKPTTIEKPERM